VTSDKELRDLLLRADALLKTNWLHAVQLLTEAVENHPQEPRPLIKLGEFYLTRELFEKAIKCFQSALKLSPDDDHLKLVIGNTYFAEGEYRLATVYYDQIAEPHTDVRYNKALALAYQGRHADSIQIMRELLDLIDNNPFIYFLLIEQLLRVDDLESARAYIRRAEAKIGRHRHLTLLKGLTYARQRIWLHAYDAFASYEKSGDFNLAEHTLIYATCAVKLGMQEKAIAILEKGLARHVYEMGFYEDLLRLLIERKQFVRARQVLKQAKRFFPTLSPVLRLMQARLGNPD